MRENTGGEAKSSENTSSPLSCGSPKSIMQPQVLCHSIYDTVRKERKKASVPFRDTRNPTYSVYLLPSLESHLSETTAPDVLKPAHFYYFISVTICPTDCFLGLYHF